MTWNQEFGTYAAVLGLSQLFTAIQFFRLLRAQAAKPRSEFRPSVGLIIPCKGAPPGFEDNVRSILAQEYAGKLEISFVVPSQSDPAFTALSNLSPRPRVIASNLVPEHSSGKAVDLLFAVDRLSPEVEVFAFADSDIRVEKDWLAELIAPLSEPGIVVSSSAMLYLSSAGGFWTTLRAAWMAAGIPYSALLDCITGQSFALSRRDFDSLGVRQLWREALMEDMSLALLVRRRGGGIRFASRAMPFSEERCDARSYFELFNKWLLCFRVYDPFIWFLALVSTFAHVYIVYCSLLFRPHWEILLLLFAGDAAYLATVSWIYRRFRGRSPFPAWAILLAPILWASYALQLLHSLWTRDIRWGGRTYRLHAPDKVEVLA